jgi:hypothetical protein
MRLFRSFFGIALLVAASALSSLGQQSQPAATESAPGIQDNSFLVEEAYNQEDGVIQHINSFMRSSSGDWVYTFTDEWPLRTEKHQLSVMLAATHSGSFSGDGLGDTAFNYRYQLIGSGESKVAVAPRLSLLVASGDATQGRGFGGTGVQIMLPMSVQHNKWLVTHWNLGTTMIPHQRSAAGDRAAAYNANLGQSFILQPSKRFNVLMETVWSSNELVVAPDKTVRQQTLLLNPGIRWAYNFKSGLQIVPGVAMPIGVGPSSGQKGVFLYLSFEHPLAWAHSKK